MTVTFDITAEPSNGSDDPPRVVIDALESDTAKSITKLSVWRDGVPVRGSARLAGNRATAYDFWAPFGKPINYRVEASVAGWGAVHTELWANLTGWTATTGSPAVASGMLRHGGVSRVVALPAVGRVQVGNLPIFGNPTGPTAASLAIGGANGLAIYRVPNSGVRVKWRGGALTPITFNTAGWLVAEWGPAGLKVTTPDGSWNFGGGWAPTDSTVAAWAEGIYAVPKFTIEALNSEVLSSHTETVTLDEREAWLIHASNPALSKSIDPGQHRLRVDGINVARGTGKTTTHPSTQIEFDIPGRKRALINRVGRRGDGRWNLILDCPRAADSTALKALLDDQQSVMFRYPDSWPWDLEEGWYGVGEFVPERVSDRLDKHRKLAALPMIPASEPVSVVAAQWNWSSIANTYTFADLRDQTFLEILLGPDA